MNSKIELGQFYTRNNPFQHERFSRWLSSIPNVSKARFVEPFGGSNSIVKMILATYPQISATQWSSYDVHPEAQEQNLVPSVQLQKQDTIEIFPEGYEVCITNPPYLAKNSATRKGLSTDFGPYQDLFEVALNKMLHNCGYVAAIIPESFITRQIFRDRLEFVVSLNFQMFDDTEFPVCLAVFSPQLSEGFEIWRGNDQIALLPQLDRAIEELLQPINSSLFNFNRPNGEIGLQAIDGTKRASIRFRPGEEIPSGNIKVSSRSLTRIGSPYFSENPNQLSDVIRAANDFLFDYRELTNDVYLTSFKGLRLDGLYRRRLDWRLASRILGNAILKVSPEQAATFLATPRLV